MESFEVFEDGERHELIVDANGLTLEGPIGSSTLNERAMSWSDIQAISYPSPYNVQVDLSEEPPVTIGFRSPTDQSAFRELTEPSLRSATGRDGEARPDSVTTNDAETPATLVSDLYLRMAVRDQNGRLRYPSEPFEMSPVWKRVSFPTPARVRQAQDRYNLPRYGPIMEGVLIDGLGVEFVAPADYKPVTQQSKLFQLGLFNDVSYAGASQDLITLVSEARGRPTWIELGWARNYDKDALDDLLGGRGHYDDCLHFEERAPAPSSLGWLKSSDSKWTTGFVPSGIVSPHFPQRVLIYQGATNGWPGQIWTINRETPWGDTYTYFLHLDSLALASDDWELIVQTWRWKSLADYDLV